MYVCYQLVALGLRVGVGVQPWHTTNNTPSNNSDGNGNRSGQVTEQQPAVRLSSRGVVPHGGDDGYGGQAVGVSVEAHQQIPTS